LEGKKRGLTALAWFGKCIYDVCIYDVLRFDSTVVNNVLTKYIMAQLK